MAETISQKHGMSERDLLSGSIAAALLIVGLVVMRYILTNDADTIRGSEIAYDPENGKEITRTEMMSGECKFSPDGRHHPDRAWSTVKALGGGDSLVKRCRYCLSYFPMD